MLSISPRAALAVALAATALAAQKSEAVVPQVRGPGAPTELVLKYGHFDPLRGQPAIPAALTAGPDGQLHVVQFHGRPDDAGRDAVEATGARLVGYLPHNAYVVRMAAPLGEAVAAIPSVRWVGAYQPAWRLESELLLELSTRSAIEPRQYYVVVTDKSRDKPALARAIEGIGGRVDDLQEGGLLMTVTLDGEQLVKAAHLDHVLWIDRVTAKEVDMDNARIQGGGNYIEAQGGYTGAGVRGHVYEGVEANHADFNTPFTNVASGGAADTHGHCTAGIVFGNGNSNPAGRGMAPDARGFYTNYSSPTGSRNSIIGQVVNTHECMFTTASWGDARTTQYTSVSADSDDIIFDHRIPWTQSQSNAGNPQSRPQAWAKNIFSIGGVAHGNNSNPADDSWRGGGGSTGPAADGRIKPDLSAYYDNIGCSDRTGSAGYSSGSFTPNFGGTSGATPIVAGHNALAIQMYTDGLFRNPLRVPGGTRFQNRPFAQTLKAIMIASAQQYAFTASSTDNRREHVGWGFPSLRNLWDNQNRMLVVAEDDVLTQGTTRSIPVTVPAGEPELKVCMTFVDPAGNPASSLARINDLTLKVTSPSGTVYWGNNGLSQGNYSVAGGAANTIDTVECVFVQAPQAGNWTIEIQATLIAQDAHIATGAVDATYALAALGVNAAGVLPRFSPYGNGCGPASNGTVAGTFYESFGTLDFQNSALRFTPAGADRWQVVPAPGAFDPVFGTNLALGDDVLARNLALGFSFPLMGGGATTAIDVDSNGWIGLVAGQHAATDFSETGAEFAANPARIAAFWDDLNPGAGGSVHFDARPGKAVVTWSQVPEFSIGGANTMQIQLFPNGEFVLAYGGVSSTDGIVGYSRGNTTDPGSIDITNPTGGAAVTLGATGSPRIGTTFAIQVGSLPAGASGAVVNLGLTQLALDLTGFGMPRCSLLASIDATLPTTLGGGGASVNVPVPNDPSLIGANLFSQGIVLAPGANTFGALTTNGGSIVFGN